MALYSYRNYPWGGIVNDTLFLQMLSVLWAETPERPEGMLFTLRIPAELVDERPLIENAEEAE